MLSSLGSRVRLRGVPPSKSTTYTSQLPLCSESNTSRRASGDQRGVPQWEVKLVSWMGCVPSASLTQMFGTPPREEANAILRPSGEYAGSLLSPAETMSRSGAR
jgi:hypothetical protein